jgi:hypothetical protein
LLVIPPCPVGWAFDVRGIHCRQDGRGVAI